MFVFVLIHQADFFGGSQLSPKKFFRRAISTSFWSTMRSSLAILSFFSFNSSDPPKALEPFSDPPSKVLRKISGLQASSHPRRGRERSPATVSSVLRDEKRCVPRENR